MRFALPALAAFVLAVPAAAQVQVQELAPLDFFSSGPAGLGPDLWKDASGEIARQVIPQLAMKPMTPAAANLARRVLATGAAGPQGVGDDPALGAARVRALLALGAVRSADTALENAPDLARNADLAQAAAEAALIAGKTPRACAVAKGLTVARDEAYWLRLRAYCQAVAGDADAAHLTLTLASQQAKDPVFSRLMGAKLAGGEGGGAASLRNGLDYALSRDLQLDLLPVVSGAPTAIVAAVALDDTAEPASRIAAAARAEQLGVFAPGVPKPDAGPATETELLAMLAAAKGPGPYVAAARANRALIGELARAATAPTSPLLLARAAVAAGDLETARLLRGQAPEGAERLRLDALIQARSGKPEAATLSALAEATTPADGAALALLTPLGGQAGPQARARLASLDLGKSIIAPGRDLALDAAAAQKVRGEAALLVLAVALDAGAAGPSLGDRARLVGALQRAGLAEDARAFAVEGLLAGP